jgi:hypothetical protein
VLQVINEQITQCVYDYYLSTAEVQQADEQLIAAANKNLQKELKKFPAVKKVELSTDVSRGLPSEEILKQEKKKGGRPRRHSLTRTDGLEQIPDRKHREKRAEEREMPCAPDKVSTLRQISRRPLRPQIMIMS